MTDNMEGGGERTAYQIEAEFKKLATEIPIAYIDQNASQIRTIGASIRTMLQMAGTTATSLLSMVLLAMDSSGMMGDLVDWHVDRVFAVRRWFTYAKHRDVLPSMTFPAGTFGLSGSAAVLGQLDARFRRAMERNLDALRAERDGEDEEDEDDEEEDVS